MSQLAEKEFFDEYDNLKEVEKIVCKKRYTKVFEFLYHTFNNNKKWVTPKYLQEGVGMVDRSNAYQILESFRVLNMLSKKVIKGRNAYYSQTNLEYWEEAKKTKLKKEIKNDLTKLKEGIEKDIED